jgi:hypothetical protein
MVVAECLGVDKVKDSVSISVNQIVALGMLQMDEPLQMLNDQTSKELQFKNPQNCKWRLIGLGQRGGQNRGIC